MIYDLGEYRVQTVGDRYFVAPNAAVIGQVVLGEDASVWFSAVLRADNDRIVIGDRSNIRTARCSMSTRAPPSCWGRG